MSVTFSHYHHHHRRDYDNSARGKERAGDAWRGWAQPNNNDDDDDNVWGT